MCQYVQICPSGAVRKKVVGVFLKKLKFLTTITICITMESFIQQSFVDLEKFWSLVCPAKFKNRVRTPEVAKFTSAFSARWHRTKSWFCAKIWSPTRNLLSPKHSAVKHFPTGVLQPPAESGLCPLLYF